MTLKKTLLLLTPLFLAGCMMAPARQDPRWTDEALAAQPPHEAPVFVPTLRLSADERTSMRAQEADVIESGRAVLADGQALRGPDPDSERYAAEQRARTQPPQ
ncbi:hypothetical protein ABWI01_01510 [Oceanicaulis alexandrii]|uniref:hypothetical protein n=1 Tax=Oceanicaulis TaxID=153232 RepID=UPI0035CF8001